MDFFAFVFLHFIICSPCKQFDLPLLILTQLDNFMFTKIILSFLQSKINYHTISKSVISQAFLNLYRLISMICKFEKGQSLFDIPIQIFLNIFCQIWLNGKHSSFQYPQCYARDHSRWFKLVKD